MLRRDMAESWIPPSTFEERLKNAVVPPRLYIRYKAMKELWKGEREVRLLSFLVPKGRSAVDAGANKGVYAHFLAKRASRVLAFEPNPKIFAVLARAKAANVESYPIALSNVSGEAELRLPQMGKGGYSNQGGSLSVAKVYERYRTVAVATKRLDDYALDDLGFLKIDVEGFEEEVIAGAAETIRRCRPNLLVEIEERYTKVPVEQTLARIVKLGYCGLFLDQGGVLCSLEAFDPVAHHRKATAGYVNNFLFLPLGPSAAT